MRSRSPGYFCRPRLRKPSSLRLTWWRASPRLYSARSFEPPRSPLHLHYAAPQHSFHTSILVFWDSKHAKIRFNWYCSNPDSSWVLERSWWSCANTHRHRQCSANIFNETILEIKQRCATCVRMRFTPLHHCHLLQKSVSQVFSLSNEKVAYTYS